MLTKEQQRLIKKFKLWWKTFWCKHELERSPYTSLDGHGAHYCKKCQSYFPH